MPEEFITQRVNIANPPTLLLAVEALLNKREGHLRHTSNTDGTGDSDQAEEEEKGVGFGISKKSKSVIDIGTEASSSSSAAAAAAAEELAIIDAFLARSRGPLQQWVDWYVLYAENIVDVSVSIKPCPLISY